MADQRPPVAIGHVILPVNDVGKSYAYYVQLGLRPLVEQERFGVLELRGGTHIVVLPAETPIEDGASAPFDLIVDDIQASWKDYERAGCAPSEISKGQIHDSFKLRDPSGYDLTINSTHASDQPI